MWLWTEASAKWLKKYTKIITSEEAILLFALTDKKLCPKIIWKLEEIHLHFWSHWGKVQIRAQLLYFSFDISVQVKQTQIHTHAQANTYTRSYWNHLLYKPVSIKENAQQLYFQSKAMLKHSDDTVFDRLAWLHHHRLTEWKVTCGQTEQTHRMAVNTTNDRRSRRNTHTHTHTFCFSVKLRMT